MPARPSDAAAPTVAIDVHDAHVAMPHGSGIYVRRLIAALGAQTQTGLRYRFLGGGGVGPELLWEQVGLPRRLHALQPAVIHAPNCFLPLRRPCPGVVTVHDLAFEAHPHDFSRRTGWKYRTFTRLGTRSAERVICVSKFTATDVCRRYGVDREKVRVIAPAPALPLTDAPVPSAPYLLAVGDLRPKKDLKTLVSAWVLLRREGLAHRLVLAGKDLGEGRRLRHLAGSEPLELPGFVSDRTLDGLLRGASALVHPSLYEGFGLNVMEAMARDCPTVLARAGALPETGGDAALYFAPGDVADLAGALRRVLDDEALRVDLVDRGRARSGALSWEATARATTAVYRELI